MRLPLAERVQRNRYTREEVALHSEGKLMHPLAPRFPAAPMLMIDEITEVHSEGGNYGRGYLEGRLPIARTLWFFDCHFIGDPVMPGCLGLDALWQLTGFFMAWQGYLGMARALGVKDLSFREQVRPENHEVIYQIHVRRLRERPFVNIVADGVMLIDGVKAYTASNLRVGMFQRQEQQTG